MVCCDVQAVDPIVLGKVRAKQYYSEDGERSRNMGILMHGDGSFAGQGVVYETLDMSALPDYTCGGTIHVIVNNQARFMPCFAKCGLDEEAVIAELAELACQREWDAEHQCLP